MYFRLKKLKAAAQICADLFSGDIFDKFYDNDTDVTLMDTIKEIATGFDDNILTCRMMASPTTTCYKYFQDLYTQLGVCFSFNLLSAAEVTTKR